MQKKLIALAVAGLASTGAFAQSSVEITGNVDMSVVSLTGSYSGRVENTAIAAGTAAAAPGAAAVAPKAWTTEGIYQGVAKSGHTYNGVTPTGAALTEYGSRAELQANQRSTSKISFRGTEDLGGGLKAFFTITSNIAGDGGQANGSNANPTARIIGDRESSVGMTGSWGTAKFGRMTIMMDDALEPFTNNGIGAYGNVYILPVATRYNNVIHLESPTWNGAKAIYQYAMAENSDRLNNTSGQGSTTNIGVYYDQGPLKVRVHHLVARDYGNGIPVNTTAQADATALPGTTDLQTSKGLVSQQFAGRSLWVNYLAASYNFGPAELFGTYMTTQSSKNYTDNVNVWTRQAQIDCANAQILCWVGYDSPIVNSATYNLGVNVPFGPHAIQAAWTGTNDKRLFNQDARQAAIGYTYQLSKRTEFYARGAKVYNTNGSTFGVSTSGGPTSVANLSASSATAIIRTTGYAAGVNHKF